MVFSVGIPRLQAGEDVKKEGVLDEYWVNEKAIAG